MKTKVSKSYSTRMKIFHAALNLLNTKEIEAITIRDIAKEAKVSIGTFYYYYKTKFDVYCEAYKLMDDYFEDNIFPNLPDANAFERLKFFFSEYCKYNTEQTPFELYRLLVKYANPRYEKNYSYGMQRVLSYIIQEAQQKGEISGSETANEITNFLLTCVRGCFRQWAVLDGSYDIKEVFQQFIIKLLKVYLPEKIHD